MSEITNFIEKFIMKYVKELWLYAAIPPMLIFIKFYKGRLSAPFFILVLFAICTVFLAIILTVDNIIQKMDD